MGRRASASGRNRRPLPPMLADTCALRPPRDCSRLFVRRHRTGAVLVTVDACGPRRGRNCDNNRDDDAAVCVLDSLAVSPAHVRTGTTKWTAVPFKCFPYQPTGIVILVLSRMGGMYLLKAPACLEASSASVSFARRAKPSVPCSPNPALACTSLARPRLWTLCHRWCIQTLSENDRNRAILYAITNLAPSSKDILERCVSCSIPDADESALFGVQANCTPKLRRACFIPARCSFSESHLHRPETLIGLYELGRKELI